MVLSYHSTEFPSDFVNITSLNSVSCNASHCIAVSQYVSNQPGNTKYPFLLSTQDGGNNWTFPSTIITNLPADYQNTADFIGVHCNRNICIAVGNYKSSNWAENPFHW